MEPILDEFKEDLKAIGRLVILIESVGEFSAQSPPNPVSPDVYSQTASVVHKRVQDSLSDIPILTGTLILYLAGRFESFVRTRFEDMCERICTVSASYDELPRQMRVSLIKLTAHFMADERRIDYTGKNIQPYITTLAENLRDRSKLDAINVRCLSTTTTNMWPDTLDELYKRVGADDIWAQIGQQADVKVHYTTSEPLHAASEAKKKLYGLMELRNKIAHPSTTFNWPNVGDVKEYIIFLELLATAISQVTAVYAVTLHTPKK